MNLVQINERLKDLPMQVLQQYANGMNPEVPPYLALGELQRREMSQKQAATAQGAAQGPQPSVKEQVEQRAGLMALQQMQQQQMAQQMQQPRGPMPAPAGVPQPEAQPEAMARGGLAAVPVRRDMFDFQRGGIVAFSGKDGSQVKEETEQEKKERIAKGLQEYMRKNNGELPAGVKAAYAGLDVMSLPGRALMGAANTGVVRPLRAMGVDIPYIPESMFMGDSGSMTPAYDELRRAEAIYRADQEREKNMRAVRNQGENMRPTMQDDPRIIGATPPDETVKPTSSAPPKVISTPPMPGAPRPAPTQVGAPAAPQTGLPAALAGAPAAATSSNPYEARLNQVALKEPVAPTAQDAINRISELSPEAMQEEFIKKRMQEQRDRAASERTAFEKSRPSGLDDLIRVLGQAGQYKGFSGIGPAYTANQQQRRAEDLAMERRQNELLNAVDAGEYERSKALFTARTGAFDTAQQLFGKEKEGVVKATASLYETTQSRINNELKMLSDKEIQQLKMASDKEIAAMKEAGDTKRTQMTIGAANARDPNAMIAEYVGLKAKARELREKGDPNSIKEADRLMAKAADIMEYKGGSSGAAGERNDITAIKAIQASLQKELSENLRMDAATRARKQAELDKTYTDLARLGGAGAATAQKGTVVDFSSLPK